VKRCVVTWCLTAVTFVLLAGWHLPVAVSTQPAAAGLKPAGRSCTSFCLDNGGRAVFGSNYDDEIWEGLLFVNKPGWQLAATFWHHGRPGDKLSGGRRSCGCGLCLRHPGTSQRAGDGRHTHAVEHRL